jgi:hypothetical protein
VDVTASDVASDSTSQEASTVDSPPDVHPDAADASIMDGPRDVSTVDVGVDAGADADAAQPAEGGPPSDGGILGVCPVPNSNGGVLCNGGQHCASGKVCCVNIPMFSAVTEACTDISACNVASVSYPFNWGLACRNAGDCPVGTGCCYQAADGGGGVVTTCTSSCPPSGLSPTPKGACQNSCECGGLTPVCNELVCLGAHYGVCGGTAGGSICP